MLYKHTNLHVLIIFVTMLSLSEQIFNSTGDSKEKFEVQPYNVCDDLELSGPLTAYVPVRQFNAKGDKVYVCDMVTDGGGWLIIQSRKNRSSDFNANWQDYKNGFGSAETDFWLGNELLHQLTELEDYQLRVELEYNENTYTANYGLFKVGAESDGYRLRVAGFSGTANDSLSAHNNARFSTPDVDNDQMDDKHCANRNLSGWWFTNCFSANLNGKFTSIMWQPFHELNKMSSTVMKIRLL